MTTSLRPEVRITVPRGAFAEDVPLVAVERGEYVGSLHRGSVCVADVSGKVTLVLGSPEEPVFLRSAAKPFQVMPAVLGGAIERFGLTDRELALLAASHSAEERHTDTVLAVLARAGLDESALRCGIHPPLHAATAEDRARRGLAPTPACNNCSGAHTGMLLACLASGWPIENYGDPDHPLQKRIREVLAAFAGMPPSEVLFAIDNCAVPTFLLPMRRAAQAFARLATGQAVPPDLAQAARRVRAAMIAHPEMVAGEARFDTDLMAAADGRIVCKGGAEGFQGVGLPAPGLGIAIKISDGNARAIPPVTLSVLSWLGAAPGSSTLESYRRPTVENHDGNVVGRLVPVFELDGGA